jgi:hypothetical protein
LNLKVNVVNSPKGVVVLYEIVCSNYVHKAKLQKSA